jgi:hypothetical protein
MGEEMKDKVARNQIESLISHVAGLTEKMCDCNPCKKCTQKERVDALLKCLGLEEKYSFSYFNTPENCIIVNCHTETVKKKKRPT